MRAFLATNFSKIISRMVPDILYRLPSDGAKRIYLTFDDGPTAEGTPELLEILAQHRIPATFFLVGAHAQAHPGHVRDLVSAGHLIGNHTFTHIDAWRKPWQQVVRELCRCNRVLEDMTGRRIDWMRPPYGRITRGLVRWSRRHGRHLLLWDVMPGDFARIVTVKGVARSIERHVQPGSVICLHDSPEARRVTPAALRICLPRLLDAGWQFSLPAT